MDDEKDYSSLSSDQIDTIKIDDLFSSDTITIDISDNMSSNYIYTNPSNLNYGNVTINTSNNGFNGTWGAVGSTAGVFHSNGTGLHVNSNAEFDGDVKIKGVSVLETLQKIEKRLAILRPDPEKLAHFESLRKAYEHYKTLEALCELPPKEEE